MVPVVADRVEVLARDTMLLCVERIGPWVQFTPNLHELLSHCHQLIRQNGERGLLFITEENLEVILFVLYLVIQFN